MVKKSLALLLATAVTAAAWGGGFPEKPVEAIVPWAAGGGADILFRALSSVFPKHANGHPLLIKNIAGAAGVPGVIEFMKAAPDGYTIVHWNGAQTIKTHMSRTPFTATQFAPVCGLVNDYYYLMVRTDSQFRTMNDLVAYAKANPEEINYGNAGAGGGVHFAQIMFENAAGFTTTQVPFQGGGPMITGLLNGQVDVAASFLPEGAANVLNGQLRVLAVFAPERQKTFPDAPTAREQGLDLVLSQWRGIYAPAGTPPARIKELEAIFKNICEDPEYVAQCEKLGTHIQFSSSEEYAKIMEKEDKDYRKIISTQKLGDIYSIK
ncbi:MAG: tripartite tricarboxylate transporter substrate binding protein [Planctomycetota bacterium]|jgi:tripartite-type tricarboxylate transporter receptor subunit TctC|nr:tripartite tricarboxylate transporter substrate binding protein [Planctomycetota bacterium]